MEREVKRTRKEQLYGVFLFLIDETGSFLAVTNLKLDRRTQKVPGQLTAPAERVDENEKSIRKETIPRTVDEEVGSVEGDVSDARFRGIIVFSTEFEQIYLVGYEKRVSRKSVHYAPRDKQEIGEFRWMPLADVGDQTITIGDYQISLFRSPVPEFVANILKVRLGQKFPLVRKMKANVPSEVFDFLDQLKLNL